MSFSTKRENIGKDINNEFLPPSLNPDFSESVKRGL